MTKLHKTSWYMALQKAESLWECDEYILVVSQGGYAHNYRRLYFDKITSVAVVANNKRMKNFWILSSVILLILGFFALISLSTESGGPFVVGIVIASFLLPHFIMNLILGPSCHFVVYTENAHYILNSLGRESKAHKLLPEIMNLIKSKQQKFIDLYGAQHQAFTDAKAEIEREEEEAEALLQDLSQVSVEPSKDSLEELTPVSEAPVE